MAALSSTIFNTSFLHHQPHKTMHSRLLSNRTRSLFGLKSSSRSGATMMASYKVTLITPWGTEEFECPDDVYIVDQAEETEIVLPYSCKSGACTSCTGKIKSGSVNQLDGNFLEEKYMNAGWVLTCVAYPTSDVVIETHKEAEFALLYYPTS